MSIDKITSDDHLSQSKNLIQENIDQLKKLFPEIVSEGKVDFKSLQQVLGEEIEDEEEFYRFTWAGKSQSRREAHKPSTGTLRPCKDESLDWDTTENLYIEGDNLEVLKLLQKSYADKIKLIYIDPPYNTGKDFVYKDNYKDNLKNYQEVTGQFNAEGKKLSTNSDSDGRYHSNWLNMMYPRLRLARNLLKDDGVIFISIDDNEVDNLKKVGNEVFGESNFVANIIWEKKFSPQNDAKWFSANHDHILVFSKNKEIYRPVLLERTEEQNSRYKNPDNDPRGPWSSSDLSVKTYSAEYDYPIETPKGNLVELPSGRCWMTSQENMKKLIQDNRIWFGKEGNNLPRLKRFLSEVKDGITPLTIWNRKEVGDTQEGKRDLLKIIPENLFQTPKTIRLIKRILQLSIDEKDQVVLDFFSGSNSTHQSIIEYNLEKNLNIKYIGVQLPEEVDHNDKLLEKEFKTIADIGKVRSRRVARKIREEYPIESQGIDLGFKVFKLDSSNIKSWDGNPENLESSLFDSISNIKSNRTEEDVLYEILLKYGLDLTLPIEERDVHGKKVFNVGMGSLFICLGDDITSKVAEGIGKWKEECDPEVCRVIFKDNGFTDVEKTNSVQILKRFGINEIRSI